MHKFKKNIYLVHYLCSFDIHHYLLLASQNKD